MSDEANAGLSRELQYSVSVGLASLAGAFAFGRLISKMYLTWYLSFVIITVFVMSSLVISFLILSIFFEGLSFMEYEDVDFSNFTTFSNNFYDHGMSCLLFLVPFLLFFFLFLFALNILGTNVGMPGWLATILFVIIDIVAAIVTMCLIRRLLKKEWIWPSRETFMCDFKSTLNYFIPSLLLSLLLTGLFVYYSCDIAFEEKEYLSNSEFQCIVKISGLASVTNINDWKIQMHSDGRDLGNRIEKKDVKEIGKGYFVLSFSITNLESGIYCVTLERAFFLPWITLSKSKIIVLERDRS